MIFLTHEESLAQRTLRQHVMPGREYYFLQECYIYALDVIVGILPEHQTSAAVLIKSKLVILTEIAVDLAPSCWNIQKYTEIIQDD